VQAGVDAGKAVAGKPVNTMGASGGAANPKDVPIHKSETKASRVILFMRTPPSNHGNDHPWNLVPIRVSGLWNLPPSHT
jgi:hypothetical protein